MPCTFWPVKPDDHPRAIRAPGAPPILVLGTTGDPATPLSWSRALARELDSGTLLVYDGNGHTAFGRGVGCIDDPVVGYLVRGSAPVDGEVCRP